MGEKGEGSGVVGGGKWGRRGREVGGKGEGTGNGYPPVHPLCYGKRVTVFAVAIAAGDIIKYQPFVYGNFVWGIHVRYNNKIYYAITACTTYTITFGKC